MALALVLVIRPLAGWLSLLGSGLGRRERGMVSFYGVRGIASVFLLAFALEQVQLSGEAELWVVVVVTIVASGIVHGLSARLLVDPALRPERV